MSDFHVMPDSETQDEGTSPGPNTPARKTALNVSPQPKGTVLNTALDESASLASGAVLCGKYEVKSRLDVRTGEADLFLCTCAGKEYVAKLYRRRFAIKPEVVQSLSRIDSPYIAPIYDRGEHMGYPVEIIPYYRNGSLQGRIFTLEQLKETVIPSLNAGLKALHNRGILHKDLKPSNIMFNDDGRTVSILDFGISSAVQSGNTVVVTRTGLTPEYSAPETFRNLFLAESDYYSLGITLFELFTGRSPYEGMEEEEIARFATIQKVPLPEDMDADLKNLITGLTYNDITNRKNKDNPNRRWTYEEVENWCAGIVQPIPGSMAGDELPDRAFRPFRFQGRSCTTMDTLLTALATDWENGKKQLFRGILTGHFNSIDPEISDLCAAAQDEMEEGEKNADLIFFETVYRISPGLTKLFWRGAVFNSLDDFAIRLLDATRRNAPDMDEIYHELMTQGVLSAYLRCVAPEAKAQIETVRAFESQYRAFDNAGEKEKLAARYLLGYTLSDKKTLLIDGQAFTGLDALTKYMTALLEQSPKSFDSFSQKLLHGAGELDIQFECWLRALGKGQAVKEWKAAQAV